jgi:DUF917 family protein
MAVEMGGFNTFVPMLVSLENNIPFLDVDGAARAVPALTTLLFDANGYDTLPIALADYIDGSKDYDKVLLDFPEHAKDAGMAEDAARQYISTYMGGIAGLSGWMTEKNAFDPAKLPEGSVSRARAVGNVLRNTPAADVFKTLQSKGIVKCRGISGYTVLDGETKEATGFDYGYILFYNKSANYYFRIDFQNENLLVSRGNDPDNLQPMMTAPDIICSFRISDNTPLTNADFFDKDGVIIKNVDVMLGLIQVSDVWWYSGLDNVNSIWKPYFAHVGYTGDIIQFGANPADDEVFD